MFECMATHKAKNPTVRVKETTSRLIHRIVAETGATSAEVVSRLMPEAELEEELERVLREKRKTIDEQLKAMTKEKKK